MIEINYTETVTRTYYVEEQEYIDWLKENGGDYDEDEYEYGYVPISDWFQHCELDEDKVYYGDCELDYHIENKELVNHFIKQIIRKRKIKQIENENI